MLTILQLKWLNVYDIIKGSKGNNYGILFAFHILKMRTYKSMQEISDQSLFTQGDFMV